MWLDNASDIDILFYEPYARIIADIAKNEQYNPLTVGVFGLWGAGKSTLLKLIGEKLKSQDGIICVTINAWMFESYDDAKTAIMEALLQELKEEVPVEETKKKLGKLIKRVDWFKLGTKAISTLAPVVASVATGNPLPMLLNVTGSAEEIGNTVKNAANSIQSLKDEYWKELKRYIRCVGELTEEEVEKFLSLYKKSIEDLVQLFSADQRMKEYLGL